MTTPLLNIRMNDGSRHFAVLRQSHLWYELRDHMLTLHGAELIEFATDGVTEAWMEFSFRGFRFSINDQLGEYWFFVNDPGCDSATLDAFLAHAARLLEPVSSR